MRRLIYTGASALIASGVSIGSASAATTAARFGFTYATSYGKHDLSQRYAGPITTGQSYDTGVAIRANDTGQKAYSLVEANPNVGVGGLRGAFPAISRTLSASSSTPKYLGSYYILRRTSNGTVDTTFGDHGYVRAFGNNTDSSYKFTSLCIDSGTGKIVLVGQQTTPAVRWGVVERLLQPASGSDTAEICGSSELGYSTPR
ncbi:MAG: hypothetical protein QOK16_4469 [Solirubrobacteraceae bacterium]|nr:hypothetical protein [Solirubrobacteraceae bacterium]